MTRSLRRLLAACALLAGLFGTGLLLASPASAHATVVTSDPTDGTRLKTAPSAVTITFDENVGLGAIGFLHVTDQTGRRVDARAAFHPGGDGSKVTDTLTSGLGDGTYTASFRVISADSHPVAGTIAFVVGDGALVRGSVGATSSDGATGVFFDGVRWLSYAGLALLGGLWVVLVLWPEGRDDRRARRIVWSGWGALTLGAVLEVLTQGTYAAGASVTKLFDPTLVDATLHSTYGQLHSARLVLLGLLAIAFARSLQADARPHRWEAGIGVAVLAAAVTFSAGGHAATTAPEWLSVPVDALHLLAMATWIGGLVMLVGAVLPRRAPDELRAVLPTFSAVAFTSVVVLTATGTYSAWRGIGTWDAVFGTTYGLVIVAKVVLLLGILAVANLSRRLVHRPARRRTVAYAMSAATLQDPPVDEPPARSTGGHAGDDPVATERLRRAVFVEALLGIVVLALSAVLVNEPRGREALAASYREPVSATASLGGKQTVTLTADPGTHGSVNVTITLGGGATATSITASATQLQRQIGPIPLTLRREGGDTFDGTAALPVAGRWQFELVVTSSAFDAVTTDVSLSLH